MDLNTIAEISHPGSRQDLQPWRSGDAWLAGGTWLFSEPQPDLSRLIDLGRLGWAAQEINPDGLRIGATCTLAQLAAAEFPSEWSAVPLFRQCCQALLGSFKVWNAATVGGNLCMALPAGPMAALITALQGVCIAWTPDGAERRIPAADFIVGPQQSSLRPGELLRAIDLPLATLHRRTAFQRISLTPLGRSGALSIGTVSQDGDFALTVTASTRRPVHLEFDGTPSATGMQEALAEAIPDDLYYDDVHGHPLWRRHMTFRLAEAVRRELAS